MFTAALETKNLKTIKLLVLQGVNVRSNNDFALRWASTNGDQNVVSYLLDTGCKVPSNNFAAVRWAYDSKHYNLSKLLLSHCTLEELKSLCTLLKTQRYNSPKRSFKKGENPETSLLAMVNKEASKKIVQKLSNKKTLDINL